MLIKKIGQITEFMDGHLGCTPALVMTVEQRTWATSDHFNVSHAHQPMMNESLESMKERGYEQEEDCCK